MKILVMTQEISSQSHVLGFFQDWLNLLAKRAEKVYAIGDAVGEYDLDSNIIVKSLGKEKSSGKLRRFLQSQKLLIPLLLGRKVDVIFLHMIDLYVFLVFPWAKIMKIPITLWKSHGRSEYNWRTKIAFRMLTRAVAPGEGSIPQYESLLEKYDFIGFGLDCQRFQPGDNTFSRDNLSIITVGRLSPIKGVDKIIEACYLLKQKHRISNFHLKIIGKHGSEEQIQYVQKLKQMVQKFDIENHITFLGHVPYDELPSYYQKADIFINMSQTRSPDKVLWEATACGAIPISCNYSFRIIMEKQGLEFLCVDDDANALATKVQQIWTLPIEKFSNLRKEIRQFMLDEFDLRPFIDRLYNFLHQQI